MARETGASCRLCRRENLKLFLKGDRCYGEKCAFERRAYAPGQHGQRRSGKLSDYQLQLREKQKVKRIYGVLEKQFRRYYYRAEKAKGNHRHQSADPAGVPAGQHRFRMGFALSRTQARQLVRHNTVVVNGKKVNIPSYQVRVGDVIEVRENKRKIPVVLEAMETVARRGIPNWMEVEKEKFRGILKTVPNRAELIMPIQESLIVELYCK